MNVGFVNPCLKPRDCFGLGADLLALLGLITDQADRLGSESTAAKRSFLTLQSHAGVARATGSNDPKLTLKHLVSNGRFEWIVALSKHAFT